MLPKSANLPTTSPRFRRFFGSVVLTRIRGRNNYRICAPLGILSTRCRAVIPSSFLPRSVDLRGLRPRSALTSDDRSWTCFSQLIRSSERLTSPADLGPGRTAQRAHPNLPVNQSGEPNELVTPAQNVVRPIGKKLAFSARFRVLGPIENTGDLKTKPEFRRSTILHQPEEFLKVNALSLLQE